MSSSDTASGSVPEKGAGAGCGGWASGARGGAWWTPRRPDRILPDINAEGTNLSPTEAN